MMVNSEISDAKGFDSYQMKLGDLMRGERATLGKSLLDVQRDLRIKAAYIAAIENCDPSVFQTQGFVAGHVRSYARYLSLDPDDVFAMFCAESGFAGVNENAKGKPVSLNPTKDRVRLSDIPNIRARKKDVIKTVQSAPSESLFGRPSPIMPDSDSILGDFSPRAGASIMVLVVLVLGIGYGGWAVLQDIQRVEFAPVQATPGLPIAVAAVDENKGVPEIALPITTARIYRPQELDVPVMVARDGPISGLNPETTGVLAQRPDVDTTAMDFAEVPEVAPPQVTENVVPVVRIVAVRPAWVRLSESDGSVLFEKILNAGESFELPQGAAPLLRAGNAGYVFVTVGDETFGPVGNGTSVAKNIALNAQDIRQSLQVTSDAALLQALENPNVITLNAAAD